MFLTTPICANFIWQQYSKWYEKLIIYVIYVIKLIEDESINDRQVYEV